MLKLLSVDYKERLLDKRFNIKDNWSLTGLKLSPFTIITGLNSAGKTRTCNLIKDFFLNKLLGYPKDLRIGDHNVLLKTSEDYSYRINIDISLDKNDNKVIKKDELHKIADGMSTLLYNRDKIYDMNLNKIVSYRPPKDSLTFHARRDEISYPYIEEIMREANNFYFLDFEELKIITVGKIIEKKLPKEILPSLTPAFFDLLVTKEIKNKILEEINLLGFAIKDISIEPIIIGNQKAPMLFFKERGVKVPYDMIQASQGMNKIIFLIVILNLMEDGSCILIDNLGDGLDYKRSMDIVPIIEEKSNNKQIIMCTNNEILLNQTDIRNWNILHREGTKVRAFNYENNKDQLNKFADSGLSNYEYFMSKYYIED